VAVTVTRTGPASFVATNDDPNAMWEQAVADYSSETPAINVTLRHLTAPGETWSQVDQLLSLHFGV
jgi:hypothetical protein